MGEIFTVLYPYKEIILRLALALICGAAFGIERQQAQKPVGARTNILICVASCEIAYLSAHGFTETLNAYSAAMSVRTDPARLVVGVLTGIGFIGAGIIYKERNGIIQGITTAASVYLIACVGIGIGLGQYFIALSAAVIGFITLMAPEIGEHVNKLMKK
jgi:putative Mg2+ transporter-C (MgtC) family protein